MRTERGQIGMPSLLGRLPCGIHCGSLGSGRGGYVRDVNDFSCQG